MVAQRSGAFNASVREKRREKREREIKHYREVNRKKQEDRQNTFMGQMQMLQPGKGFPMAPQQPLLPIPEITPENQPHHTLFVESLEEGMTETMLVESFKKYHGFKEVRYIAPKHVAFVEYMDESYATAALNGRPLSLLDMNGRIIYDKPLTISYAKK